MAGNFRWIDAGLVAGIAYIAIKVTDQGDQIKENSSKLDEFIENSIFERDRDMLEEIRSLLTFRNESLKKLVSDTDLEEGKSILSEIYSHSKLQEDNFRKLIQGVELEREEFENLSKELKTLTFKLERADNFQEVLEEDALQIKALLVSLQKMVYESKPTEITLGK
jgi:hypothetical protein